MLNGVGSTVVGVGGLGGIGDVEIVELDAVAFLSLSRISNIVVLIRSHLVHQSRSYPET